MKKIIQLFGLITLVCFSFFYTEEIVTIMKEVDPIMIQIQNKHSLTYQEGENATVKDNTIIPGIKGKEIDIDKSYTKMKRYSKYHDKYLLYRDITPNITIDNIFDKFIISGNPKKNNLSLVFILDNEKYINKLYNILNNNQIITSIFIDDTLINNQLNKVMLLSKHQILNFGLNGTYTKENILINNNILKRTFKNTTSACLSTKEDLQTLKLCKYYKIHTYNTNIILNDAYNYVKNNLQNGIIITLKVNDLNLDELGSVIKLIKMKGINLVTLDKLIQE